MVLCVPGTVPSVVAYLFTQHFQFCRMRVKNKLILFDDNETNLLSACVVCARCQNTLAFRGEDNGADVRSNHVRVLSQSAATAGRS